MVIPGLVPSSVYGYTSFVPGLVYGYTVCCAEFRVWLFQVLCRVIPGVVPSLSLIHISEPRDYHKSRMPSSA